MSSSAARLVALALVIGGGACDHGSSFPPSDMSFEQFCPARQAAIAAIYARCEGVPLAGLNFEPCASQAARVAAGRLAFDRSLAAGCVRDWQTASCEMLVKRELFACIGVLEGTVGTGGACATDFECGGDLYCDFSAGACPGTCRDTLAADAACDGPTHPPCVVGASCVAESGGAHCRALVGQGGACGPGVGDCDALLACVPASATASGSTCQPCTASGPCEVIPFVPPGGACTSDTVCAAGTGCVAGACTDCSGNL